MSEFVKVATTDEVAPGEMKMVEVEGEEVLLVNLDGEFYALSNICTHAEGPLAEGYLEEDEVECPWHGSRFNVRTGAIVSSPAVEPQPVCELRVEGQDILVKPR